MRPVALTPRAAHEAWQRCHWPHYRAGCERREGVEQLLVEKIHEVDHRLGSRFVASANLRADRQGTTSGDGGSRVAMSEETRGSDAAALSGGDTRDDYTSAMDSSDGAARARKRRREAVDASGARDETMGGDDDDDD
eukprot:scaffold79507_cov33-Phaeocystis_antarctica.AAC.1